jgi:hypothetical protein
MLRAITAARIEPAAPVRELVSTAISAPADEPAPAEPEHFPIVGGEIKPVRVWPPK